MDRLMMKMIQGRSKKDALKSIFIFAVIFFFICFTVIIQLQPILNGTFCEDFTNFRDESAWNNRKFPMVEDSSILSKLGLDDLSVDAIDDVTGVNKPVIITAASANFGTNTEQWIRHILKADLGLKIIIYDIGMTDEQLEYMMQYCEVRPFPFDMFPNFVRNFVPKMSWKPLLIQLCLKEFGSVIWMDCAIRFKNNNIQKGIERANREGIAIAYNVGITQSSALSYITGHLTFESFGHSPCEFHKHFMFNGGLIFITRSKWVERNIMLPWVSCALNENCIGTTERHRGICTGANRVGFCHKFDSSALSIILHRLYRTPKEIRRIDIDTDVEWIKCYYRPEVIVVDGVAFSDYQKYEQKDCLQFQSV